MTSRKRIQFPPLFALVWLMTSSCCADSELYFTASPLQVQVPVTATLQMKCSLYDVVSPSTTATTGLVGRDVLGAFIKTDVPDDNVDISKTSKRASTFKDDIRHIASMSITRDGVTIATVSPYTSARPVSDVDKANIHVSGDVTGTTGELGYLKLDWTYPTESQSGVYECRASGVTDSGQIASFSISLDVQKATVKVNLDDVVRELHSLTEIVLDQNSTLNEQKRKLNEHERKIALQEKTISAMGAEIQESKHIETGYILCNDSDSWANNSGPERVGVHPDWVYYGKETRIAQTFKSQYNSPPVVFLSISHLMVAEDQFIEIGTQLLNVDNRGFSMRCGTYDGSDHRVRDIEVNWIAVPAQ